MMGDLSRLYDVHRLRDFTVYRGVGVGVGLAAAGVILRGGFCLVQCFPDVLASPCGSLDMGDRAREEQ